MKFTYKMAAFASVALLLSSCSSNEVENVTPSSEGYGYIRVGVSNDVTVKTRAEEQVTGEDLKNWTITATGIYTDGTASKEYNLNESNQVKAGTYTVKVKSHSTTKAIYTSDSNYGAPYYEGQSESFTITAGQHQSKTIACGTAKNARIKVNFPSSELITNCVLTIKTDNSKDDYRGEAGLQLSATGNRDVAYYEAGRVLTYELTYDYNNASINTPISKSLTLGGAATESVVNITTNNNGTISIVTITYDDSFNSSVKETITINAADGSVVTTE